MAKFDIAFPLEATDAAVLIDTLKAIAAWSLAPQGERGGFDEGYCAGREYAAMQALSALRAVERMQSIREEDAMHDAVKRIDEQETP